MSLPFDRVWTQQPQFPVQLAAAYSLPGAIAGIAQNQPIRGTLLTGSTLSGVGSAGRCLTNNGANLGGVATSSSPVSTSRFSVVAVVEFNTGGAYANFVDRDFSTTMRSFQFRRNLSNQIELIRFDTTVSSIVTATTTGTVVTGVPYTIIAVVDGLNHSIFLAGERASAAITGTPQVWDGVLGLAAAWGGTTGTGGLPGAQGLDGKLYAYAGIPRVFQDAEARSLIRNPWQLFTKRSNPIFVGLGSPAITAYYPGSDISVAGWTSSSGGSLYADIDDVTLDRGDYITSPDLSTTATFGWKDSNGNPATIPAGTWSVDLDAAYFLGASGQVRLVWLDAGGSSVGATSWQTLTSTDATYTLSITTTGASTQFRYEDAP